MIGVDGLIPALLVIALLIALAILGAPCLVVATFVFIKREYKLATIFAVIGAILIAPFHSIAARKI